MPQRTVATVSQEVVIVLSQSSRFLTDHQETWTDYNVPYQDGQELERLVVESGCRRILEIGTSTGHSTLWLARGAARTGGRVVTVEIDRGRHERALRNFEAAGVAHLIDARLGEAMKVVPTLDGDFDFVFSDATWATQPDEGYLNFFKVAEPKLRIGALYTMHNVTDGHGDDGRFFRHLDKLGSWETTILRKSSAGISVSRRVR